MYEERGTGVFGSVGNGNSNVANDSKIVDLETFNSDNNEADTIYNLLFKEFDEEKKN